MTALLVVIACAVCIQSVALSALVGAVMAGRRR